MLSDGRSKPVYRPKLYTTSPFPIAGRSPEQHFLTVREALETLAHEADEAVSEDDISGQGFDSTAADLRDGLEALAKIENGFYKLVERAVALEREAWKHIPAQRHQELRDALAEIGAWENFADYKLRCVGPVIEGRVNA